jgi:aldose 1-epimerase
MRRCGGVLLALLPLLLALATGGLTPPGSSAEGPKGKPKPTKAKAGVAKVPLGKTKEGKPVDLYVLTNANGVVAKVMTYGATLTELWVPDKEGNLADVTLGFDTLKGYEGKGNPFFGCVVGRYANRIAKGRFTLNGREYKLAINNPPNHLHGGLKGFDKKVWTHRISGSGPSGVMVNFKYTSPDREEGYPGTLAAQVTYRLTNRDELSLEYEATTDKPTIVNLTNHAYFNLAGQGAGSILGHEMTLLATEYTPTDKTLIPTGKIEPVKGTPYDFTKPNTIGSRIKELKGDPGGYDVNYVLDRTGRKTRRLTARVREPKSGRMMTMFTTEPGVQFYTGNFLDGTVKGKGGVKYGKHAGFCLEAQYFPDSPNKKTFPSPVLRPGKTYTQTTIYRFEAK